MKFNLLHGLNTESKKKENVNMGLRFSSEMREGEKKNGPSFPNYVKHSQLILFCCFINCSFL